MTSGARSAAGRPGASALLLTLAVAAQGAQLYGLYRPSGPPTTALFPHVDKLAHAAGFALPLLLILLARRAAGAPGEGVGARFVGGVAAIFAAHAVVSELIQHRYYQYRSGDPLDVLADWLGIGLGWLAYRSCPRAAHPTLEPASISDPRRP